MNRGFKFLWVIISSIIFLCGLDNAYAEFTGKQWLVRARVIDIHPIVSSNQISIIGGKVTHISSQVVPELDFSYFINSNVALELILGTARHHVMATNTALGTIDLGKVSHLPPVLTLQYHFCTGYKVNPYVGAGINYTLFYNVNHGPVASSISYEHSIGPAFQVGTDVFLNKNILFNLDIKKVLIRPNVTVHASGLTMRTKVHIDPYVFGIGLGYLIS